jgi:phosphohistidine phosphatase
MRNLILLRHAKSSWKDILLDDFDRPLNNRGRGDAPKMAGILAREKIKIDLIISSSALRTSDTAKIFADILGYNSKIRFDDKLYEASYKEILDLINLINEKYKSVLLICHNPGITNLVNFLSDQFIDNIPTTGMVGLSFNCSWKELNENSCSLLFYDYPKKK